MTPGRSVRCCPAALLAALPLLLAVLAASGCGEAIHNSHEDDRFIRSQPGESAADAAPLGKGTLFPASVGARWSSHFTLRPMTASADGVASPAATEMDADVVCAAASPGGAGTARLETRVAGRTAAAAAAAPLLTETYRFDASGVALAAQSGGGRSLTLTPPLPLLHTPVREGAVTQWKGTVHTGGQNLPATGYSRVSYGEQLALPAGKIGAYRVDTMLLASMGNGQQASYPMVRWFAPGIGIVKQRFLSGGTEVTQTLVRYRGPGR